MKTCTARLHSWVAAIALAVAFVSGTAWAGEAQALQIGADAVVTSITAQRTFAGILPSAADPFRNQSSSGAVCAPAGWEVWASPFGRVDSHDSKGIYNGYDFDQFGGAVGLTRSFGNAFFGVSVGFDSHDTEFDGLAPINDGTLQDASMESDSLHTALYGGATFGSFFVDAYAGFSRSWNEEDLGAWGDRYGADYTDNVFSTGLTLGNIWNLSCDARFLASIGVDYSHVKTSKYDLKSLTATDNVRSSSLNSVEMPIMIGLDKTFSNGAVAWTPEVRAGWIPRFGERSSKVNMADTRWPDDVYYARSARQPSSYGVVGAGLTLRANDRVRVGLDYDFRFASKETSHTFSASLGIGF